MNFLLKNLNSNKKVLILGEVVIDEYIFGNTERISSEYPIPVFNEIRRDYRLGGSGNVAKNIKVFGIDVSLLTLLGINDSDRLTTELMKKNNINFIPVVNHKYKTIIKTRYISNNYQSFRSDIKECFKINDDTEKKIIKKFIEISDNINFLIISDYGTGLLSRDLTRRIIEECNKKNIFVLVDPKRDDYSKFMNANLIKPNRQDAEYFCKNKIIDNKDIERSCKKICRDLNISYCIMTLSEMGMCICSKHDDQYKIKYIAPEKKEVRDVVGAGDTIISSILFGLINNINIYDSCEIANNCASSVISEIGTTAPNIMKLLENHDLVENFQELKNLTYFIKKYKKKVIFTSGCFDLIHKGHIETLKKSKELGDYLFVALNSDKSIKRLKGISRPICGIESRLSILRSIKYVDFIMIFEEDTPVKIVDLLDPDIIAKGGDYDYQQIKKIFPNVKEFKKIEFVSGFSTTNIIKKIEK